MAILDSPESFDSTASNADRSQVRRRPRTAVSPPRNLSLESGSSSLEAENSGNDTESERNDSGLIRSEELPAESESEGLSCGGENEEKAKESGESTNGEGQEALALIFAYRPSAPAHRTIKERPLCSDAIFKQSHAGLLNLCIVVLVAVNSRLIIENLMKYGWLIKSGFWFGRKSLRDWPLLMCCLTLPIFPLAAFLVEKLVQKKHVSELPSYPRTGCVRKGGVLHQLIKLVVFTGFMGFIIEQYINPIVRNSEPQLKGNFLYAIERVLKLSVPNLYVWLCMFYCFFHLWLNILAELLCFGDCEFY